MAEHALLDVLLGLPAQLRWLSSTPMRGLQSKLKDLTQARLCAHWGHANPAQFEAQFIAAAMEKVRSCGGTVSVGKKGQRMPVRRENLALCFVNYSGQGTYAAGTNWCVPCEALPLGAPLGEPSGQPNEPGSSSSGPAGPGIELDLPNIPEPFGTWWPVLAVLNSTEGRFKWLTLCGTQVLCVCVYQWTWPEPGAWTITVVPLRPSRL